MRESRETNVRDGPAVIGSALDHLIGTGGPEDEQEVVQAIRSCERIDEELWELVIR